MSGTGHSCWRPPNRPFKSPPSRRFHNSSSPPCPVHTHDSRCGSRAACCAGSHDLLRPLRCAGRRHYSVTHGSLRWSRRARSGSEKTSPSRSCYWRTLRWTTGGYDQPKRHQPRSRNGRFVRRVTTTPQSGRRRSMGPRRLYGWPLGSSRRTSTSRGYQTRSRRTGRYYARLRSNLWPTIHSNCRCFSTGTRLAC